MVKRGLTPLRLSRRAEDIVPVILAVEVEEFLHGEAGVFVQGAPGLVELLAGQHVESAATVSECNFQVAPESVQIIAIGYCISLKSKARRSELPSLLHFGYSICILSPARAALGVWSGLQLKALDVERRRVFLVASATSTSHLECCPCPLYSPDTDSKRPRRSSGA